MAVVLRLKRMGRRNHPTYRITATNNQNPRDGRTLENLGYYDPASPVESLRVKVDAERVRHWLDHGAQPSETVASILRKEGIKVAEAERKPRKRPGRKKTTATKTRRTSRHKTLTEAKEARRNARLTARREAAKAAKAGSGGEESGS